MENEELKNAFEEKLGKNYAQFMIKCLAMSPSELIDAAEEIAATKMMIKELPEVASVEDMEYLMRFEDPLEIVSSGWMLTDDVDHTDELQYTLGSITCSRSADRCYPLDPEYAQDEGGMTLC